MILHIANNLGMVKSFLQMLASLKTKMVANLLHIITVKGLLIGINIPLLLVANYLTPLVGFGENSPGQPSWDVLCRSAETASETIQCSQSLVAALLVWSQDFSFHVIATWLPLSKIAISYQGNMYLSTYLFFRSIYKKAMYLSTYSVFLSNYKKVLYLSTITRTLVPTYSLSL